MGSGVLSMRLRPFEDVGSGVIVVVHILLSIWCMVDMKEVLFSVIRTNMWATVMRSIPGVHFSPSSQSADWDYRSILAYAHFCE